MKDTLMGMLMGVGITSFLSSIMWTFVETGDRWLWFSRMAVVVLCAGFLYLGECIKESK